MPIGVAALLLVRRWVPVSAAAPAAEGARFDFRGFALISPGLAALVYGCSAAGDHGGFASPAAWGPMLGGLVLVTSFVLYSLRTKIQPLLDLRLFRDRAFAVAMLNAALMGATLFGAMFLLPLYFQQAHGFSPLRAGLVLAPQGVGTAISTFLAGRLTNRAGPRVLVMTGTARGDGGDAAARPGRCPHVGGGAAAPLFLRGLGLGMVMAPLIAAGYSTLRRESIPQATTTFNILNRVGGSIGTAVLAVFLVRGLAGGRRRRRASRPPTAAPSRGRSAAQRRRWWRRRSCRARRR